MGGGATGEVPDWAVKPSLNGPRRPAGIYVARFRNVPGSRSTKFLRGYGFQGGGHSESDFQETGFGAEYKKSVLDPVTTIRLEGLRSVGTMGKLRGHRPRRARYLWNSRAAHQHDVRPERVRHGAGHG